MQSEKSKNNMNQGHQPEELENTELGQVSGGGKTQPQKPTSEIAGYGKVSGETGPGQPEADGVMTHPYFK